MKYLLLCHDDPNEFQDCVNEHLRLDWKLQGGVSIAGCEETYESCHGRQSDVVYRYAQALVKEE